MAWPKEHKSQTHDRIVEAAAAALRGRGLSGVRVEEIMATAGLTRGGFYAHFDSKDDLLGEALEWVAGQTMEKLSRALESVPPEQRIHVLIDTYLSAKHAAHPEQGCPFASVGAEVARSGGTRRQHLARGIKRRLEFMRGLLPARRREQASYDRAVGVLACMVGGMILARAAGRRESAAVLEACRAFLHDAV